MAFDQYLEPSVCPHITDVKLRKNEITLENIGHGTTYEKTWVR